MKQRLCGSNKEALRWCRARQVVIQFANWKRLKNKKNIPEGITCCVFLGRLVKYDKTLIKTVNKWIEQFNKEKEFDKKKVAV